MENGVNTLLGQSQMPPLIISNQDAPRNREEYRFPKLGGAGLAGVLELMESSPAVLGRSLRNFYKPALARGRRHFPGAARRPRARNRQGLRLPTIGDRKSTRLNSSHGYISYAVFCLK